MKVNHSQSRSTWLVLPLSLLTFVGLLSSLSSHFQPLRASYILPQHTSIPVQIEQIPLEKQVEFVQQDKFWNMGQQGDDAWAGTIPANGGFLRFRLDNGTAHFSGVTMFHQLHCLQILRSTLVALELGKPASHDHNPHSADHSVDPQLHWVHCLDYLRQVGGIMM